jgi:hypothetical protein
VITLPAFLSLSVNQGVSEALDYEKAEVDGHLGA